MICRKITIIASGTDEDRVAEAIEEAAKRFKDERDYSGSGRNEDSAFTFNVQKDVFHAEWPH